MSASFELPLQGGGGEPVDLWRTIVSHGVADLPPSRVDEARRAFETTLRVQRGRPRRVRIQDGRPGYALIRVPGPPLSAARREAVADGVRRVLNLDEDLSPFYELVASDRELAWARQGAGRMLRTQTVFEVIVKTVCTTNCAWSGTVRMVSALVEHLGEPAVGGRDGGPLTNAFPTPAAMAEADETFYREVVRAGYRGAYLRSLAASVADGSLELEELATAPPGEVPDDEVAARLLALPGVGPYAAAHIMMLLGRHSLLILDSWTRPKYARLVGKKRVGDATIKRRFRRYGRYAGLAFWLYVTRDWVSDESSEAQARLSAGEPA